LTFVTLRLESERLEPRHLPEIRRMHRDALVMAELGGVRTEEQTAAYFARNLKHWDDFGFGLWVLLERGGAEPVGRAVLRHLAIDGLDEVEVGYAFYPPFWGRGLATEVTAACLDLARERLGLRTVVALTSPNNLASQHVLRKNGLVYEREITHEGAPCALFRVTWPTSGH
jgi:ribosomal-protein-alanine N-acetyltransferase